MDLEIFEGADSFETLIKVYWALISDFAAYINKLALIYGKVPLFGSLKIRFFFVTLQFANHQFCL